MTVDQNIRITSKLWEDFHIPSSLSDNVGNDSKSTSTAQKCRQTHCSPRVKPNNETVNEEHNIQLPFRRTLPKEY